MQLIPTYTERVYKSNNVWFKYKSRDTCLRLGFETKFFCYWDNDDIQDIDDWIAIGDIIRIKNDINKESI